MGFQYETEYPEKPTSATTTPETWRRKSRAQNSPAVSKEIAGGLYLLNDKLERKTGAAFRSARLLSLPDQRYFIDESEQSSLLATFLSLLLMHPYILMLKILFILQSNQFHYSPAKIKKKRKTTRKKNKN